MVSLKLKLLFAEERPAKLAMYKENVHRQLESEEWFKVVSIVLQLSEHIVME